MGSAGMLNSGAKGLKKVPFLGATFKHGIPIDCTAVSAQPSSIPQSVPGSPHFAALESVDDPRGKSAENINNL